MDVLVTGAHGTVGTAVREQLGGDPAYEFTWMDRQDHPEVETVVADMRDYPAMRAACEGQDAVVHLAHDPTVNWQVTDVSWGEVLAADLEGIVTAFGAAVDAGVEKVVYASTNHVVGMYENERRPEIYDADDEFVVDHEMPVRPDSMYGVAKVFGEALARFCSDWYGLRCHCLRIGGVPPGDEPFAWVAPDADRDAEEYERAVGHARGVWCSHRDFAQLLARSLDDETDGFDVFYAVSGNAHRWHDISHAREVLGYDPRDDASEWDLP
ncbi:MAG: NAD-dependent epimerase/dehydratase family protein [Halobacteriaceae archaeon]